MKFKEKTVVELREFYNKVAYSNKSFCFKDAVMYKIRNRIRVLDTINELDELCKTPIIRPDRLLVANKMVRLLSSVENEVTDKSKYYSKINELESFIRCGLC
jgi:hypothetical protein